MSNFSLQRMPSEVQGYSTSYLGKDVKEWTDLNLAMETALGKFAFQDWNTVLRFDLLPPVALEKEKAVELCYMLLQAIVQGTRNAKLLLSIKTWDTQDKTTSGTGNTNHVKLGFQTNFSYSEEWAINNTLILAGCQSILETIGGKLEINQNGSGCLFWIWIPGKN